MDSILKTKWTYLLFREPAFFRFHSFQLVPHCIENKTQQTNKNRENKTLSHLNLSGLKQEDETCNNANQDTSQAFSDILMGLIIAR